MTSERVVTVWASCHYCGLPARGPVLWGSQDRLCDDCFAYFYGEDGETDDEDVS